MSDNTQNNTINDEKDEKINELTKKYDDKDKEFNKTKEKLNKTTLALVVFIFLLIIIVLIFVIALAVSKKKDNKNIIQTSQKTQTSPSKGGQNFKIVGGKKYYRRYN